MRILVTIFSNSSLGTGRPKGTVESILVSGSGSQSYRPTNLRLPSLPQNHALSLMYFDSAFWRFPMKELTAAFILALALPNVTGNTVLAGDEEYVKVELKGRLQVIVKGGPPGLPLSVWSKRQQYALDVKDMPGGPPTEKQLKEWDGEVVIVEGRLELQRDALPRVHATRVFLYKKPGPFKN
jgi:hypothetical protein